MSDGAFKKYLCVFDHPYYPDVESFDDPLMAAEEARRLLKENSTEDGHHESHIYVCEVLERFELKTHY